VTRFLTSGISGTRPRHQVVRSPRRQDRVEFVIFPRLRWRGSRPLPTGIITPMSRLISPPQRGKITELHAISPRGLPHDLVARTRTPIPDVRNGRHLRENPLKPTLAQARPPAVRTTRPVRDY